MLTIHGKLREAEQEIATLKQQLEVRNSDIAELYGVLTIRDKKVQELKQHNAELLKDAQRLWHVFGSMRNRRVDSITLEELDAAIASASN